MKKTEIFTIPNLLSFFRLLLIPVFCVIYCAAKTQEEYAAAAAILLISTLTDFLDGKIARHFHMISELGKALDPIADKLTHAAVAFCVTIHYPMIWALIALMAVKEGYMAAMDIFFLKRGKKLDGAMWFGKVCTALLFFLLLFFTLFPTISTTVANTLIIIMMGVMLATLILYIPVFRKMNSNEEKAA